MRYAPVILLMLAKLGAAEETLCSGFQCLARNSMSLYSSDYKLWWEIYNSAAIDAKKCTSHNDVKTFLMLWSGQVDGEMAEAFYEDTDLLIKNQTSCFFSALKSSETQVVSDFLNKWCPFLNIRLNESILSYVETHPSSILGKKVLERISSDACKY